MTSLDDLLACRLDALEEMYEHAPMGPPPRGLFRGRVLARVEGRLARSRRGGVLVAPFERLPFGIDFERSTWFFVAPQLRVGRFRVDPGPSRWRDAEVLRLEYDVSRLPRPLRGALYDEVKPLGEGICLGLGGVNAGRGDGEIFFFALHWPPGR